MIFLSSPAGVIIVLGVVGRHVDLMFGLLEGKVAHDGCWLDIVSINLPGLVCLLWRCKLHPALRGIQRNLYRDAYYIVKGKDVTYSRFMSF